MTITTINRPVTKTFSQNKIRYVPPIVQDLGKELLAGFNNSDILENYVQRFEVIKEYCDFVLDQYKQSKKSNIKARK